MKYMALTLVIATSLVWADGYESPASIPAFGYRSIFADYKRMSDEVLQDWRQANDEMGLLRGHGGHLEVESTTPDKTHQHLDGVTETAPGERR